MALTRIGGIGLFKFQQEKEIEKNKDDAIQSLGVELAQEKMKNMQKDIVISNLRQEVSKVKLDIMKIKGGQ